MTTTRRQTAARPVAATRSATPREGAPAVLLTADLVVFTVRDEALHVLLVRRAAPPFAGQWAIPGGFVGERESLEEAALRQLREEAGVTDVYLEQLYTFGAPDRDPRGRVVSVAYYALIAAGRAPLAARGAVPGPGGERVLAVQLGGVAGA